MKRILNNRIKRNPSTVDQVTYETRHQPTISTINHASQNNISDLSPSWRYYFQYYGWLQCCEPSIRFLHQQSIDECF